METTSSGPTTGQDRQPPRPPPRALTRSRSDRMVGGLCGGLGRYFEIDPIWFRLGFILLAIGGGSSVLIYLILWVVVPEESEESDDHRPRPFETASYRRPPPPSVVIGLVLLSVGWVLLINAIAPSAGRYFWPVLLVCAGAIVLAGGLSRDRS